MQKTWAKNKGFTKVILATIVVIGVLAYFNVDLRTVIDKLFASPIVQSIWTFLKTFWAHYLAPVWIFLKANLSGFFTSNQ